MDFPFNRNICSLHLGSYNVTLNDTVMKSKSDLSIATHILLALAHAKAKDEPVLLNSKILAKTIGSHEVVIRRLLAPMVKAGILNSHPGRGGGVSLAVKPAKLKFDAVLEALESGDVVKIHSSPEIKSCPVSCQIASVLEFVSQTAELALKTAFRKMTLEQLYRRIHT